jgi:NADH:ubiquinone oxidoreductase subunit F (NADH-binding)
VTITDPTTDNDHPAESVSSSRVLAGWHETGRADLGAHISVYGQLALPRRGHHQFAERILDEIRNSGLTGRGGASFPAARKWDSIRGSRNPLLVVNAMEGEPASGKDRALLSGTPHLVLDGAQVTALATGAREIAVCVADDNPRGVEPVQFALAERSSAGLGGVPVRVLRPPATYVSGEESALVGWIAGGDAKPTFRKDKATPLVVRGSPALVHNAETLAHVALIARYGSEWFRAVGMPDAPGTSLVSASGALERPGVYEVALGTPVGQILHAAGLRAPLAAVLMGGYGGTWLHPELQDVRYAPGPLAAAGSAMGAGVLGALPVSSCGVAETARIATYMAQQSAGQCGPCVYGLPAVADDLMALARGEGDRSSLSRLRARLDVVAGRGACRHPDGVVRLVRSALGVFAHDLAQHAKRRPCEGSRRRPVFPTPLSPDQAGKETVGSWRRG